MRILKGLAIFILMFILAVIILIALAMPELEDKHMAQVISLIGVLTALVSVVWTQYNKSIEEKNKLKLIELEKKYQISKETYQKLFEEKIKVYEELYIQINKFKKQLYDVGRHFDTENAKGIPTMQELTADDVNIKTLQNIFETIQNNHFIISNEMMDSYLKLYDLYRSHTREFDFMLDFGALSTPDEIEDEWREIKKKFYKNYKRAIENFFNQIEKEIKTMKKEIGFI